MNTTTTVSSLPSFLELEGLLNLGPSQHITELVNQTLIRPLADLMNRPGKKVRGHLVELGYRLAHAKTAEASLYEACSEILEAIHAGSLIVDDIQDGSRMRRGQPTLHLRYGIPVALNAGNWLYFWPMQKIRSLGLTAEQELEVYQLCHQTLLRAHFGQALDVGISIDSVAQAKIPEVCRASLELKSGALMALAISLGAVLGGAHRERQILLNEFGHRFGVALQMFDDIGNLRHKADVPPESSKRFEDLLLKRASWIWVVVSENFDEREFAQFVHAVQQLPNDSFLVPWLEIHEIEKLARAKASEYLKKAIADLESGLDQQGSLGPFDRQAIQLVHQLTAKVAKAYE